MSTFSGCRRLFTYRNVTASSVHVFSDVYLHPGDVLQIVAIHPLQLAGGIESESRLAEDWERGHTITRSAAHAE